MRRKSREVALQILFQTEFAPRIQVNEFLEVFENHSEYTQEILAYAEEIIHGVQQNISAIDSAIGSASRHWKIERMATIDRNLLRIATYEMKIKPDAISPAVAINEAVELAKIFGTTDSSGFINGLLDQIAKNSGPLA